MERQTFRTAATEEYVFETPLRMIIYDAAAFGGAAFVWKPSSETFFPAWLYSLHSMGKW
ncbi:MAG: hypothetical protein LBQ69_06310 [Treponema sp.]|nr:hypothetical protein [Treponema sp.]